LLLCLVMATDKPAHVIKLFCYIKNNVLLLDRVILLNGTSRFLLLYCTESFFSGSYVHRLDFLSTYQNTFPLQVILFAGLIAAHGQRVNDENRPYKIKFRIYGMQHRFEEKGHRPTVHIVQAVSDYV